MRALLKDGGWGWESRPEHEPVHKQHVMPRLHSDFLQPRHCSSILRVSAATPALHACFEKAKNQACNQAAGSRSCTSALRDGCEKCLPSIVTDTICTYLYYIDLGATGGLFACECNEGLWNHFQTLRNYLRNLRNHCQQHRQTGRNRSKPLEPFRRTPLQLKHRKGLYRS